MNTTRRDFLKACVSAPVLLSCNMGAATAASLKFGVCADPHQDIMHDAEDRMRHFIEMANRDRLDFIIQLGDFCRPHEKNLGFLGSWEQFAGPRYHTLGNHDNDGGFKWLQVLEFWKMPRRYYSFDQSGWHFVVLDGNEINPEKRTPGYPRYIGQEQQDWLRRDLENTGAPTIIFSHQSLEDPDGVENGREIRAILDAVNHKAGWRKVGACLSGHHHIDFATQIAGIHYVQVNSMSYYWVGNKFQHVRYGPEVNKTHPNIKNTVPYRESLFATVTLLRTTIRIGGRSTEFVGPSPWDLGMEEVPGSSRERNRVVPRISDRILKLDAPI